MLAVRRHTSRSQQRAWTCNLCQTINNARDSSKYVSIATREMSAEAVEFASSIAFVLMLVYSRDRPAISSPLCKNRLILALIDRCGSDMSLESTKAALCAGLKKLPRNTRFGERWIRQCHHQLSSVLLFIFFTSKESALTPATFACMTCKPVRRSCVVNRFSRALT